MDPLDGNSSDKSSFHETIKKIEYKEQQNVEGGFRFLKDPWFMVDSIFLKLPKRIEVLMMIMALCLLVYNVGQHKLRKSLKAQKTFLPNQLGKEVGNPTLKWVFQIMEGIGIVYFYDQSLSHTTREVIVSLNELRKKIIWLFGKNAAWIYGIIHENQTVGFRNTP